MIQIPVSIGELFDKVTILRLKILNMKDLKKIKNAEDEHYQLDHLMANVAAGNEGLNNLFTLLYQTNEALWKVEDQLRGLEKKEDFGSDFINLARQVYHLNDQRFDIKNKINILTNSEIREVKEYTNYK